MTEQQKIIIESYKTQYRQVCERYSVWGSSQLCAFALYKNPNGEDKNYTIVMTTISGLSDNFQPYVEDVYLLIEPDGNALKMTDFFSNNDVISYIKNLEKVE